MHDLGKGITPSAEWPHHHGHETLGIPLVDAVCERLRVPVDCRDLAVMAAREHGNIHHIGRMDAEAITTVLERCDVLRRPARFEGLLAVAACDSRGRTGLAAREDEVTPHWQLAVAAFCAVDAAAIAAAQSDKRQIPARLHEARVAAVQVALAQRSAG
jgi:tRNA nucleotidyltransferase (CCA-adding enzyme)